MLKDKNAIITGGVRGIGKAIAIEFCRQGANVMLCYKSNDQAAEALKEELLQFGTKVLTMKADVSLMEQAKAVVDETVSQLGRVDILVNNAGITKDKLLMKMTQEDFSEVIDINLVGSFNFMRQVAPVMIKQKYGRIINISSIAGVKGNAGQANYSASKAGVIGLTYSAAKELGKRNITVNAIAPGYIETDMTGVLEDQYKEKLLQSISLSRFGKPEDVAGIAVFLATDSASYITGQVIAVDGGMMI
ncbi:MAG: 3-oxoacyl-[acyl-carrier-protein] reductase [Eubacteriales bacterium]